VTPASRSLGFPLLVVFFLLAWPACGADWQATLSPAEPGPFAEVPSFAGTFRLGWSGIAAGQAHASITQQGDTLVLDGGGASTNLARFFYQIDATLTAVAERATLHTLTSTQVETYSARTLSTFINGSNGTLSSLSVRNPPGETPPKWKEVKATPIRDLFAGVLFVRSQALATGDRVRLLIYPGGAPFLVDITVLEPEKITVLGQSREALRLELNIQRVNTKKNNRLEPHRKFRSGRVWLSNDADRILLRAEAEIFIGYVFAEILSFNKIPPAP
jgi:hypothetical protein